MWYNSLGVKLLEGDMVPSSFAREIPNTLFVRKKPWVGDMIILGHVIEMAACIIADEDKMATDGRRAGVFSKITVIPKITEANQVCWEYHSSTVLTTPEGEKLEAKDTVLNRKGLIVSNTLKKIQEFKEIYLMKRWWQMEEDETELTTQKCA